MGANIRLYEHNDQRGQPGGTNVTPALSFSGTIRPPVGFNTPTVGAGGIDATDSNRLNGAINDILGIPARLSQVFLGDLSADAFQPFRSGKSVTLWNVGHRLKQYNFYFQDEWRVRRNLTLNYGVRWEINPAPTEAGGRVYVPNGPIVNNPGLVSFVKSDRWFKNNNLGAIAFEEGRIADAVGQARQAAGAEAALRVLEVDPDSRLPERRAVLAPFETGEGPRR